jgi:hypothetical protein
MNTKRAFLTLMALMLLPGLAMAQVTARFDVSKSWLDGSGNVDNQTGGVMVNMTCTTGLPLSQDFLVTSSQNVVFVLGDLLSLDDVDCEIAEAVPAGYVAGYSANGATANATSCTFKGGASGNASDDNTCEITNTPGPVGVTVYTEWTVANDGGDAVNDVASIWIKCNAPIAGATEDDGSWTKSCPALSGDNSCTASVTPDPSGSSCSTWNNVTDSSVEHGGNCGSMAVSPGSGNSCTFTFSVFFEGIPTLSQYGLAIMVLLMLGVGFVGFRRFV